MLDEKGNENYNKQRNKIVSKTAINVLVISNHNSFRVWLFDKTATVDSISKNIFLFFALEMASPGNQHCGKCIGTLSFRNAHDNCAYRLRGVYAI